MNLFFKLLFRKIPSVHQIEQEFNKNRDDYERLQKIENSEDYKEYLELEKILASKEHQNNVKKIKEEKVEGDEKHWEKSVEYKLEVRFQNFLKNDDIKFYLKEKNHPRFKFLKEWDLTFEDDFHGKELDSKKWITALPGSDFVWEKELSFADEKQAYVGSGNISQEYGLLTIETKKQKKISSAWHPKQGFVQKEFDYTSGLITTRGIFSQKEGLFEAKIRSRGSAPLHHAFSLVGKSSLPTVCILKTSVRKKYIVGQIFRQNKEIKTFQDTIKGLVVRGGYHIFSLEWNTKELIWRINNFEVFRSSKNIPQEPLCLMLNSFVKEGKGSGDGAFDIDWVRVFKKK